MRKTRQLSIFGNLRTMVYFKARAVPTPTITPIIRLVKKTNKKIPMASNRLITFKLPVAPSRYLWAVSNRTMAMASLRMDSPKMMVYSFGSTL